MRWKMYQHEYGNTRIKNKFLWIPVWIDDEIRWLERAQIEQRYTPMSGWNNIRWLNN